MINIMILTGLVFVAAIVTVVIMVVDRPRTSFYEIDSVRLILALKAKSE